MKDSRRRKKQQTRHLIFESEQWANTDEPVDGGVHGEWRGQDGHSRHPNIVLFLADDLGYGDLACYGHPTSTTPNIDRLAEKGLRFTQFYVTASICTPSRASLMTGRDSSRMGLYSLASVFAPTSTGGLPLNETTIAEMLQPLGYDTYMVGKWHLGYGRDGEFLPTKQGFQHYMGIPYSNDECPCTTCFYPDQPCIYPNMSLKLCNTEYAPCPLVLDDAIYQQPVDFTTLTQEYTSRAIEWIKKSAKKETPFLLYFAFTHVHGPAFSGKEFTGSSVRGPFGDALAEMDAAVGAVMRTLKELEIDRNTLTFFTSDNGPSIRDEDFKGSAGPLRCGKHSYYEGGIRVPAIAHWPGRIQRGRTTELASCLDILPTIASVTGASLPDVILDGYDVSNVLFRNGKSPRTSVFGTGGLEDRSPLTIRSGPYKIHFGTYGHYSTSMDEGECANFLDYESRIDNPLVFNLNTDPGESYPISLSTPGVEEIIADLFKLRADIKADLTWAPTEILKPTDPAIQPCCNPDCLPVDPAFPACCSCVDI